jgi:hypothetical protein
VVVAVALIPAAILGEIDPGGWIILDRTLNHPLLFSVTACFMLLAAGGLGLRRSTRPGRGWRVAVAVLSAAAWLFTSWIFFGMAPRFSEIRSLDAPEGRPYRVVVNEGPWVFGTDWVVTIRIGHGLLAREWAASCLDDSEPEYEFKDVFWISSSQLRIIPAEMPAFTVRVDSATGRPTPTTIPGFTC